MILQKTQNYFTKNVKRDIFFIGGANMRKKLKQLGLRLTELSTYLKYSRPTLYKYLDDYDRKKYEMIDFKVKKVFDFIMKKTTLTKISVIEYIISLEDEQSHDEINKEIHHIVDELIKEIGEDKMIECLNKIKKGDLK